MTAVTLTEFLELLRELVDQGQRYQDLNDAPVTALEVEALPDPEDGHMAGLLFRLGPPGPFQQRFVLAGGEL